MFLATVAAASGKKKASVFLRYYRDTILENAALWTGGRKFLINRLLQDLIERCAGLDLRIGGDEAQTLSKVTAYVTSLLMNYLVTGSFKHKR